MKTFVHQKNGLRVASGLFGDNYLLVQYSIETLGCIGVEPFTIINGHLSTRTQNNTRLTRLNNYVRAAVRDIFKNKTFSAINIFGLAISMSIGLLIISFVNELNSYDDFQVKGDRIYKATNTYQYLDEDPSYFASTAVLAGARVRDEVPGRGGSANDQKLQ